MVLCKAFSLIATNTVNMAGFTVLFFCIVQYLYVAYGARLPDVQGSKLEAESINSRNPKLLFGVSV